MEMPQIVWDLEDDADGNVQHLLEHDVTVEEAEEVLLNPENEREVSRSSGRPVTFGYTSTGRFLGVVWEEANKDPLMIRPITAFDSPEPRGRKKRGRKRK